MCRQQTANEAYASCSCCICLFLSNIRIFMISVVLFKLSTKCSQQAANEAKISQKRGTRIYRHITYNLTNYKAHYLYVRIRCKRLLAVRVTYEPSDMLLRGQTNAHSIMHIRDCISGPSITITLLRS
ncbi:c6.2 [Ichnoviriform fugitivi]|uniref:C6.2 n=1 Tax=Ichnoviriform fugitivi TaxID=265522 RepID=A2Q0G9_9VIRU|nr:c6.2 [Ichnoviriform fugitivi]BAF45684.1 c6.2 [Ichnoviriform fugitivi]